MPGNQSTPQRFLKFPACPPSRVSQVFRHQPTSGCPPEPGVCGHVRPGHRKSLTRRRRHKFRHIPLEHRISCRGKAKIKVGLKDETHLADFVRGKISDLRKCLCNHLRSIQQRTKRDAKMYRKNIRNQTLKSRIAEHALIVSSSRACPGKGTFGEWAARVAMEKDDANADFPGILTGSGKWETVQTPHFGEPLTVSVFKTKSKNEHPRQDFAGGF